MLSCYLLYSIVLYLDALKMQLFDAFEKKSLFQLSPGPKLSLRFEHPEAQTSSRQLEELERNFVSLARESAKETKPESANRFARLVYRLRRLDSKAADYISRRIVDCDRHGFCRPEEKESFQ